MLDRYKQADRAIRIYEIAIQINPSSIEAHYGIATALQSQGNIEEAIVHIDGYTSQHGQNPTLTNAKNILQQLKSSQRTQ